MRSFGPIVIVGFLWDSSGIHETCVGPHVTRDTHVGLVARGWLDCLVFSWVFNLTCSSTAMVSGKRVKQRQKGGVVKYRSVRYIFYVVVKFINLRFIIRIKLVDMVVLFDGIRVGLPGAGRTLVRIKRFCS